METLKLAAIIVLAAGAGEGIIEFIPAPIVHALFPKEEQSNLRRIILNALSAILGIAIALNFRLSLFDLLEAQGNVAWAGQAVTGALLGRGSNYIHAFIKRLILDSELLTEEVRMSKRE